MNLLSHQLLKGICSSTVARRMASVVEFALTVTLIFGFVGHRYGSQTGLVAACGLLLLPRIYGQAHLVDTDIPGLMIWVATAFAFWNGLYEPHGRMWRVLVGVLIGLAFIEKMATMAVLIPLLIWLLATRPTSAIRRHDALPALVDSFVTLGLLICPLLLAFREVTAMARLMPEVQDVNLFVSRPKTWMPGAFLAVPLIFWICRRLIAGCFPTSPIWGRERPGLETLAAVLAFPPVIAWLGNPAWWRETIPRLAHYYVLNSNRRGALPDIKILYLGQTYEFGLPWHNAWVLMAVTVPVGLLSFGIIGTMHSLLKARTSQLPLYFCLHLAVLPVLRMLPTPAHDGIRLFLPSFAFLSILAALGLRATASATARLLPRREQIVFLVLSSLVLLSEATALLRIHPYELSYYNSLVGGPRGAWRRGFELSYWYDAFTPRVLAELNQKLPPDAHVTFPNDLSSPTTFQELQALGRLRKDIMLETPGDTYPYLWLLTHDSKTTPNTRLLFALKPWFEDCPKQLDGARVVSVASPKAVARALALQLLTAGDSPRPDETPQAPVWVRTYLPAFGRLWGDGLIRSRPLTVNTPAFAWAKSDPKSLVDAAQILVRNKNGVLQGSQVSQKTLLPQSLLTSHPQVVQLFKILSRYDSQGPFFAELLRKDPEAISDAAQILVRHPDEIEHVLLRYPFTDPTTIGGYLDRELVDPQPDLPAR